MLGTWYTEINKIPLNGVPRNHMMRMYYADTIMTLEKLGN
jgi:hypothetical protein